ncbi:MAG: hypothetical protein D6730_23610 [Bacteroidetes bacterium]|nr:MAG: hypothetical protein D6730_23610 [Bacteroidota bacterium]
MLVLLLAGGCSTLYVPNTLHTPLLSEKGEVALRLHSGSSSLDAQAALALSGGAKGGLAVSAAYSLNRKGGDTPQAGYAKQQFAELGVGHFFRLDSSGIFEVFTGYGRGKAEATKTLGTGFPVDEQATGNYQRFFVQANLGASARLLEAGVAARFSYVDFTRLSITRKTPKRPSAFFAEPLLFIKVGGGPTSGKFPNIKAELQFGAHLPLGPRPDFDFPLFHARLGIDLRFNRRYLRDKPKGMEK